MREEEKTIHEHMKASRAYEYELTKMSFEAEEILDKIMSKLPKSLPNFKKFKKKGRR